MSSEYDPESAGFGSARADRSSPRATPVSAAASARRGPRATAASMPGGPVHATDTGAALLRAVILILLAMWLGGYLSRGFAALGVTPNAQPYWASNSEQIPWL